MTDLWIYQLGPVNKSEGGSGLRNERMRLSAGLGAVVKTRAGQISPKRRCLGYECAANRIAMECSGRSAMLVWRRTFCTFRFWPAAEVWAGERSNDRGDNGP